MPTLHWRKLDIHRQKEIKALLISIGINKKELYPKSCELALFYGIITARTSHGYHIESCWLWEREILKIFSCKLESCHFPQNIAYAYYINYHHGLFIFNPLNCTRLMFWTSHGKLSLLMYCDYFKSILIILFSCRICWIVVVVSLICREFSH